MKDQRETSLHLNQKKKIRSFSVDKVDLRKLLDILQERSDAAGDIEVLHFQRPPGQTDEQYKKDKEEIRKGFELYLTATGADGRQLSGNIANVFDSPNFPDEVVQLYLNTTNPLKFKYNYYPRNSFELFLDFQKPTILNFTILPSLETVNESNISVSGSDATWVNGVFNEIVNFVARRTSTFSWLHRHSIYDVLLWLIGFPISFWLCAKMSPFVSSYLGSFSEFLRAAVYFYIFIVAINLFRVLFHYARWIWPLTEYRSEKNMAVRHRIVLAVILTGIAASFVYDIGKWLLQ